MPFKVLPDRLRRLLTTPVAELTRWQYSARFMIEMCRVGAIQLREDRASQMAAALAYRTVFGLVPVMVIAILLFRAFGGGALFADLVEQLLTAARLQDLAGPEPGVTLAGWVRGLIQNIDANVSGKAVGIVGTLALAWAATGLLTTIERCFNTICQAPEHRSLARRMPLYWTTLTIGPVLLYLSLHIEGRLVHAVEGSAIAWVAGHAAAFLSTWVFLFGLYMLMPHTRVRPSAAAWGSLVAAVLWAVAARGFAAYLAASFSGKSSAYAILYGSLGLIPLFLLWVYFLWLVVLYGLEITQMLQDVRGRLSAAAGTRTELPPMLDSAAIIPIARVVADRFAAGNSTTIENVVEATRYGPRAVELLLAALADDGLLHRVESAGEAAYVLARPPAAITTGDLLRTAQRLTEPAAAESPAVGWLRSFRAAQLNPTLHRPLADV